MENVFLSDDDICIEINGERVGSVEKYKERIYRDNVMIEAIGEEEPIANLCGGMRYHVEFSKFYVYTMLMGGEKSIKNISNFELVVKMLDKKIVYSNCEWLEINKNIEINSCVYENVKLSAIHRKEVSC